MYESVLIGSERVTMYSSVNLSGGWEGIMLRGLLMHSWWCIIGSRWSATSRGRGASHGYQCTKTTVR